MLNLQNLLPNSDSTVLLPALINMFPGNRAHNTMPLVISGCSFSYTISANDSKYPGCEKLSVAILWYLSHRTLCYLLSLLPLYLTCKHFKVNDCNLSSSLFPACLEMATMYDCCSTDPFSTLYIKRKLSTSKEFLKKKINNNGKASLSYCLCQVNNITLMDNKLLLFWVSTQRCLMYIWGINFSPNWFFNFSAT